MSVMKLFKLYTEEQNDDIAEAVINEADDMIKMFCRIDDVSVLPESIRAKVAVHLYNRMGQEGSSAYSEGGKSQTFTDILDNDIKRLLYGFRRLA